MCGRPRKELSFYLQNAAVMISWADELGLIMSMMNGDHDNVCTSYCRLSDRDIQN